MEAVKKALDRISVEQIKPPSEKEGKQEHPADLANESKAQNKYN